MVTEIRQQFYPCGPNLGATRILTWQCAKSMLRFFLVRDGPENFVVFNQRSFLQQVTIVLGIVDSFLVVGSGKCLDRIPGIPEREQQELALPFGDATQCIDSAVAGSGGVLIEASLL